jgi:hypothetical protein
MYPSFRTSLCRKSCNFEEKNGSKDARQNMGFSCFPIEGVRTDEALGTSILPSSNFGDVKR